MSEDSERDEGDEKSPDSPASESDSSADSPADSPAEETDDNAPAEESTDESASNAAGDEPSEEPQERDEAGNDDEDGEDAESDDTDGEDAESADTDGEDAEDDDAEQGDTEDEVDGEDDDAERDDADESVTTDSESDADTEPVPEPDLSAEETAASDSEDSDGEPTDDSGEETYIEEFTVPDMATGADTDDEERDIELTDEAEVDAGVETAEESDQTLPENEDGVGVDVPQQTLEGEDEEGDLFGSGPESDQEMPLADHIEEMMRRLSVVFLVAGAVALTLLGLGQAFEPLPTAVELIDALWDNAIPGAPELDDRRPRLYGPLELILTKLKVTALAGLLGGIPVFVYETYLFMRPGLYRHERRYYLAAVPTSLVLGTIGMSFAHFVIIPAIMDYFTLYTQENIASVAYGLAETFNLILILMGYMAVVFQIPLFIMLAIMMGLTTRLWLEDKRLLFWGGFLTVAFIVNPDPTGMTPFIIAATMIVLYEGTLALLRWTGN